MRQVCLIAVLLSVVGCRELAGTSATLTMTPAVAPTAVRAGDRVTVTFTLTNTSGSAVTFPEDLCPGLLEIVDDKGKVAYSAADLAPLVDCIAGFRSVALAPGESFTWTSTWYGLVRSSTAEPAYAGHGRYRVRAWIGNRFQHVGRIAVRSADLIVQ